VHYYQLKLVKWSNWRKRRRELIDKARYFNSGQLPTPITSQWIRRLADLVRKKTPVTELETAFDKTLRTWKIEHSHARDLATEQSSQLRRARLDEISYIVFHGGKALEKEINTITPTVQELVYNSWNLMPLWKAFLPFIKDRRMHFFAMCYGYPLYVEGVFDQAVRLLYLLKSSSRGKSVTLQDLESMDFQNLRNGFQPWHTRHFF
jgi:hypothetical protein